MTKTNLTPRGRGRARARDSRANTRRPVTPSVRESAPNNFSPPAGGSLSVPRYRRHGAGFLVGQASSTAGGLGDS